MKNADLAELKLPTRLKYFTPLVRIEAKYPIVLGNDIHYFTRGELENIEIQCLEAIKLLEQCR